MKKRKIYHQVFRNTGGVFTVFYVDIFIKGGYGDFDFIFTYEKPIGLGLISQEGVKKASKIGLKLYSDRERIKSLIKKGYKLFEELDSFLKFLTRTKLKNKSDKELKESLKKLLLYVQKYLNIYRFFEPMVVEGVERAVEEAVRKKINNPVLIYRYLGYLLNSSNKETVVRKREEILTELKLNRVARNLCVSIRETGKEKLFFRKTINNGLDLIELLLEEIGRRRNLTLEQIKSCLYKEIMLILDGKKSFILKINQRKECFIATKERSGWKFYGGKRAKRIISQLRIVLPKSKGIKEFKGSIANPGLARGRVKLFTFDIGKAAKIRLSGQIKNMKKGDVLVAETTGPELILACKKAAAIITDEGGINSHAAIISRELNIPCVINTKIATKVLKDGQMVEVDADKGVVRIIKS